MSSQVNESHNVLSLKDVTVEYADGDGTLLALDGIDFAAQAGMLTAVTGESGSGKSTLLSVAGGLISPTRGSVVIDGEHLDDANEAARARIRRERIGVVFQQANLLSALRVKEQLLIADHLRGVKPRGERAEELLGYVGLGGLGERPIRQLSGGQRQRVGIARALMGEPRLLLADEPTSALDSALSHEVMQLINRITKELNVATVLVTHDRSLLDYADEAVVVEDGRVTQAA